MRALSPGRLGLDRCPAHQQSAGVEWPSARYPRRRDVALRTALRLAGPDRTRQSTPARDGAMNRVKEALYYYSPPAVQAALLSTERFVMRQVEYGRDFRRWRARIEEMQWWSLD